MATDTIERRPVVGVMGSGTEPHVERAAPLGRWLAARGVHLLTGGGRGVMEAVGAAFRGVPGRTGLVVGVLPWDLAAGGPRAGYPNAHVELAIQTHLHLSGRRGRDLRSRNHVNVLSADVVVALPGGYGTASEVALALAYGRPVIAHVDARTDLPELPDEVPVAPRLEQVVAFVERHLAGRTRSGAGPATTPTAEPRPRPGEAIGGELVRRLVPADAARYQRLRLGALQEAPTAFSSTYEREAAYSLDLVAGRLAPDAPGHVFGGFRGAELVATAGILYEANPKLAHRGELWGVFVAPDARGRGLGRRVCSAALAEARERGLRQVVLGVHAGNRPARSTYASLGFREYGREPGFLVVDGIPHDEVLMILCFEASP